MDVDVPESPAESTPQPSRPVWVRSLVFSDTSRVDVPPNGIVVLVGPNNVGKSQALRDIRFHLTGEQDSGPSRHRVVTSVTTSRQGALSDALTWLGENCRSRTVEGIQVYERQGVRVSRDEVERALGNEGAIPQAVARLFTVYASAEQRLENSRQVRGLAANGVPERPIHMLNDAGVIGRLSHACEVAFRQPLTLDRAHIDWLLRFGRPANDPEFDHNGIPKPEFAHELSALPALETQGHGVRSYVALLMELMVSGHLFALIDEPEAFLHPPQATELARSIVKLKSRQSQIFIATHDSNVVRGLLESEQESDVLVCRISRDAARNPVSVLDAKAVRALWSDPSLRYSNALDGLFNFGVVVCEGDPDCRLYESVMDQLDERGASELLFTHGGGIDRIPKLAAALRAVGIPVAAVVDIDVLRDRSRLTKIVTALDASWDPSWDRLLNSVTSGIDNRSTLPTRAEVETRMTALLGSFRDSDHVTAETADELRALARGESGWDRVKVAGRAALPAGQAVSAFDELVTCLAATGIFVVPGELETWFKDVGMHGAAYVTGVHERELHRDPVKSRDVRRFVEGIRKFLMGTSD